MSPVPFWRFNELMLTSFNSNRLNVLVTPSVVNKFCSCNVPFNWRLPDNINNSNVINGLNTFPFNNFKRLCVKSNRFNSFNPANASVSIASIWFHAKFNSINANTLANDRLWMVLMRLFDTSNILNLDELIFGTASNSFQARSRISVCAGMAVAVAAANFSFVKKRFVHVIW